VTLKCDRRCNGYRVLLASRISPEGHWSDRRWFRFLQPPRVVSPSADGRSWNRQCLSSYCYNFRTASYLL